MQKENNKNAEEKLWEGKRNFINTVPEFLITVARLLCVVVLHHEN